MQSKTRSINVESEHGIAEVSEGRNNSDRNAVSRRFRDILTMLHLRGYTSTVIETLALHFAKRQKAQFQNLEVTCRRRLALKAT